MEREDEIREAAKEALSELDLQGVMVDSVITPQDSDRRSVHFREAEGKYFRVIVDTAEVLATAGAINRETLKEYITRKLQERDPKDYLS